MKSARILLIIFLLMLLIRDIFPDEVIKGLGKVCIYHSQMRKTQLEQDGDKSVKSIVFPNIKPLIGEELWIGGYNELLPLIKHHINGYENLSDKQKKEILKNVMLGVQDILQMMWKDNVRILETGCDGKLDDVLKKQ